LKKILKYVTFRILYESMGYPYLACTLEGYPYEYVNTPKSHKITNKRLFFSFLTRVKGCYHSFVTMEVRMRK